MITFAYNDVRLAAHDLGLAPNDCDALVRALKARLGDAQPTCLVGGVELVPGQRLALPSGEVWEFTAGPDYTARKVGAA